MSLFATGPKRLPLADGGFLAYHHSPGARPGIIFLGGFTSDMSGVKATTLERWCRGRGQGFLRFDYSGHGASSGRFADGTTGAWAAETLEVLDRLTEGPQILVGSSMGAWLMLLAMQASMHVAFFNAAAFSTFCWMPADVAIAAKWRTNTADMAGVQRATMRCSSTE